MKVEQRKWLSIEREGFNMTAIEVLNVLFKSLLLFFGFIVVAEAVLLREINLFISVILIVLGAGIIIVSVTMEDII